MFDENSYSFSRLHNVWHILKTRSKNCQGYLIIEIFSQNKKKLFYVIINQLDLLRRV